MATTTSANVVFFFLVFLVATSSLPFKEMLGIREVEGRNVAVKSISLFPFAGLKQQNCVGAPCNIENIGYCQRRGCTQCVVPFIGGPICV